MSDVILVVDVETTGLSSRNHEIIDLWAVALNRKMEVLWQDGGLVRPEHIQTASDVALKINRYDADVWADSRSFEVVWGKVARHYGQSDNMILAGNNVAFDRSFLESAMETSGMPSLCWWGYRVVDTSSLAMPDKRAGRLSSRSLSSLVGFYLPQAVAQAHWPPERRHGAQADARITAAVLRAQLCPHWTWDSAWEQALWPDEDPAPGMTPGPFFNPR